MTKSKYDFPILEEDFDDLEFRFYDHITGAEDKHLRDTGKHLMSEIKKKLINEGKVIPKLTKQEEKELSG